MVVNCLITKVDIGEKLPMVVLSMDAGTLHGLGWDGTRYATEKSVSIDQTTYSSYRISHFYGLARVEYSGLGDYLVGRLTAWPYVKIHVARLIENVDQFFFNRKKLTTKRRMDLLRVLIRSHLSGRQEFSSLDLMTEVYSMRWFVHPDGDAVERQLEYYLNAMVDTGELRRVEHRFELTGHALKTIEEYEEQERKHADNVKVGRRMFWLTVAIAILTAVQAGLIQLPPLLDFRN